MHIFSRSFELRALAILDPLSAELTVDMLVYRLSKNAPRLLYTFYRNPILFLNVFIRPLQLRGGLCRVFLKGRPRLRLHDAWGFVPPPLEALPGSCSCPLESTCQLQSTAKPPSASRRPARAASASARASNSFGGASPSDALRRGPGRDRDPLHGGDWLQTSHRETA